MVIYPNYTTVSLTAVVPESAAKRQWQKNEEWKPEIVEVDVLGKGMSFPGVDWLAVWATGYE